MTSENGQKGAYPLGMVLSVFHRVQVHLEAQWHAQVRAEWRVDPEISFHLAGSARRGAATCGDLDAVLHVHPRSRFGELATLEPLQASTWLAEGVEPLRAADGVVLRFAGGLTADVRIVRDQDCCGGALAFLTGPRRFNRYMAYRLFGDADRAPEIAEIADTERGVLLDALGVWVPPDKRDSCAAEHGF